MLERYPEAVKLVPKNYPLRRHRYARKAAAAALAAHAQGKFWEFHHELFAHYKDLSDAKIREIATGLELDMERFERDSRSREIEQLIDRDLRDVRTTGVRGTPTILVNGKILQDRSLEGFRRMIDAELKKVGR